MRVFLVNPSHVSFGTAVITPRWLYVLAGATPSRYGDPILVDETLDPFDATQLAPGDVVGIGIHTANALRGYEVGQLARARGAYVVFGGIHATLYPNEAHAQGGAHAVVRGDGDVTWATVIDDCAAGTPREVYEAGQIAGATFKPARWDRLPKDRYMWASIQTVRGCPKHCSFCSVWRTDGQTPRQANIHNVLNEAVELRRRGFRFIALADDNFYPVTLTDLVQAARRSDPSQLRSLEAVRAERFALMDGLAKLPDDMVFFTQITMEAAEDPEYLQAMKRARIRGALVGVEAVTPEGLKDVHKGFNLVGEALVERLQAFRSHGVHVLGSFIFGLPSDRAATFEATADLAERAGITFAQFVMLTPYPGTIDFERWERELGGDATTVAGIPITRHWLIPQVNRPKAYAPHPVMSPDEIRRRTQAVWDHFYSLPRIWRRSRVVKTWKARLAFVLSSKLYRQMYASTGIATDSARRTRSARVARWMAGFHQPFLGAPDGFPGGFTPQFGGDVRDASLVAGVRGTTVAGLRWDVSGNIGQSQVDTFIFDTVNASLGPDSPTSFKPNLLQQTETSVNADLSYAASDMINIAGGTEWRNQEYMLGAGDEASWAIGPYAAQKFSSASNGYSGTRPENADAWDRANIAVYGDVDVHGVENEWNLGAAVRIEDFYDSFGTTMNSKLSGRYGFTETFAVRAAVSSGFRAPTPGQQNVLNVTTEFDFEVNDLVNKGTIPSTSPVAALRGGIPLQPEKSINYSVGTVVDTGLFTFTADYFRITLSDRLTITKDFSLTPDEVATLVANGIAEAGNLGEFIFFVNDFATRTQGIDLVSTWTPLALGGRVTFSGVFNYTDTALTRFNEEHINADRIAALTLGLPKTCWNAGVTYGADRWSLLARVHFYGSYWDREDARGALGEDLSYQYPLYPGKPLVDVEAGFPFGDGVTLSIGAQNVLNTYPDEHPGAFESNGNRYGQFGPFGFNGGYYYTRLNYGWGTQ